MTHHHTSAAPEAPPVATGAAVYHHADAIPATSPRLPALLIQGFEFLLPRRWGK